MSIITIPDLKDKVSEWINGIRTEGNKYFRKVIFASGNNTDTKRLTIMYSIAYSRAYRKDARLSVNITRVIKFFCPILITPDDLLKEDTYCLLYLNLSYIKDNILFFKYDIAVSNGSFLHKKIVRNMELADFTLKTKLPVGFSISDTYLSIDLKKCPQTLKIDNINIKDIQFKDYKCELIY